METRRCGRTDLVLPILGIGCFSFGGGTYWGEQRQQDVDEVVACALDHGAYFFDTAETYNGGASEVALGQALRGRRDRALIGSKIQPNHAYAPEVRRHCEASLQRLQTDRIDVYMIHWPLNANALRHYTSDEEKLSNPPRIEETLHALGELQREGKIRYLGVSNFGGTQLAEAMAVGVPLALNELSYNLLMRGIESDVLPACSHHGIGVLGYGPLAQGLLTDKFAHFDELPPIRTRTRHFRGSRTGSRHGEPGFENETREALDQLRRAAAEYSNRSAQVTPTLTSLGEMALAWVVGNPAITCTLVGARNRAQLETNLRAAESPLDPVLRAEFSRLTESLRQLLGPGIDYHQGRENSRCW